MPIKRWIERHPLLATIASFAVLTAPQWVASVWALFSSEPLIPFLIKHNVPHFGFSPWFVTAPLGILMFATVLLINLRKRGPAVHARHLRMSCDPSIEGCVKQTLFTSQRLPTNFFRVKVDADSEQSVKNCAAILTSIKKDGRTKWGGDSAKLTFAQGEAPDAFSKTIRNKVPEFFDVLAVTSTNEIYPGTYQNPFGRMWPYAPTLPEIFSEPGDYILTVAVTGDEVPTEKAQMKFTWTRNWQTSALVLITEAPRSVSSEAQRKLDLKMYVLGRDYNEITAELATHLQFLNDGATPRTILSVTFGYRDPDRVWKNSWEFITPIAGSLGNVRPLRIEPKSEHVETFSVVIPHRFLEKAGGVIGLLISVTKPGGAVDRQLELIEINHPATEGSNRISFQGRRIEGVCFD